MREYLKDVFNPALKAFDSKKIIAGLLLSLIPILNLFFITGYAFTIAKYLGKGKKKFPKIKILDTVTVSTLTLIGLIIFATLLALISFPATMIYSIIDQILKQSIVLTSINIFLLVPAKVFLAVFLIINLLLNFMYPIVAVRYQIYQYFSRIYDIHHILKLVFTKEYILSYTISVILLFGILTPINYLKWNLIIYYVFYMMGLFIVAITSFALIGRTFYILETKYKIDHIPKHAKSEIKAVRLK